MLMTRRTILGTLAGSAAAVAAADAFGQAPAGAPAPSPVAEGSPKPLPFDPKSIRGLSEKLLVSHWENNYGGAVKNLAKVREAIAQTGKDSPGWFTTGLRERELTFRNSVVLHELYFANLGGNGKPDGAVVKAAGAAFGGYARFEELLRATAMGLAGGSGWALLTYDFHADALRISWAGNHTQSPAMAAPLLVIDMYEHAYQMDYGAAAAKYVDAVFANANWDEVNRRYERALKAAKIVA